MARAYAHPMLLVTSFSMGILVNAIQIILVMDIVRELDAIQLILGLCKINQLSLTKRTIHSRLGKRKCLA